MSEDSDILPYSVFWDDAGDGWQVMRLPRPGRFLDVYRALRFRREGEIVRSTTPVGPEHGNGSGALFGGFTLAYVDLVIAVAPVLFGCYEHEGAVSVSCSTHFLAPGLLSGNLDTVTELVSETRRTVVVRGYVVQEDRRIAAFDGTMRKLSGRRR